MTGELGPTEGFSRKAPSLVRIVVVASLLFQGACGDDTGSRPRPPLEPPEPIPLTLWNRSQFELTELYVHPGSRYVDATNLLETGLTLGDSLLVESFYNGNRITIVRQKNAGERIALTTARDIVVHRPGYTLIVFDDSFRLLTPSSVDNPFSETDGGD